MEWLSHIPLAMFTLFVFAIGLGVGSFLNVLIARLPYEKSVIWPGSRCGACLQPIRLTDNLPIIGYLRLRGRCRLCGTQFSSRYLWIELGTGLAFVALFFLEIAAQAQGGPSFLRPLHDTPGLKFPYLGGSFIPLSAWVYFALHACLLSLLIAAAAIDAEHRIIPPQITYPGVVIGLIASVLLPWPWPTTSPTLVAAIPLDKSWFTPDVRVYTGLMLWPFAGPPPGWAPPGSWQLGLVNGLVGAAVGTGIIRVVKFCFEVGLGRDALGLGDADLLMMAGAFLGWQVVVLGFFVGVMAALVLKIPLIILDKIQKRSIGRELSFGPGLAVGVVTVWLGWPVASEVARLLYEPYALGTVVVVMVVGLLLAGVLLGRR